VRAFFGLGIVAALAGGHPFSALGQERTLSQVAAERSFPEYGEWWALGEDFSTFMSRAIVSEWSALPGNDGSLTRVKAYVSEYVRTVYQRDARASLVDDFVNGKFVTPLQSGEFDALSYAYFRSAFELMAERADELDDRQAPVNESRRLFTKRVGTKFFAQIEDRLKLEAPNRADDEAGFRQLRRCIDAVGYFLKQQRYYRDHVDFRFDVEVEHRGRKIVQREGDAVRLLAQGGVVYALFEMGYPVILPSAVYLFQTVGEAQHHSSRTLGELFERAGLEAGETEDFDPSGFPSDRVVELWEIRRAR
jgi:hypothetical protein